MVLPISSFVLPIFKPFAAHFTTYILQNIMKKYLMLQMICKNHYQESIVYFCKRESDKIQILLLLLLQLLLLPLLLLLRLLFYIASINATIILLQLLILHLPLLLLLLLLILIISIITFFYIIIIMIISSPLVIQHLYNFAFCNILL